MRCFSIGLVFATSLLSAPAVMAAPPSVQTILANYEKAIGGKANMAAIKTKIERGTYEEGDEHNSEAVLSKMRPYYKLVGDAEHPSKDFAEGYDGSAWEFYGDPGIVVRTVTAASSAGRHATDIISSLTDLEEQHYTASLAGMETIGGHKAYCIRITMPDGFQEDEFVDAKSWLLIAERKVAPIHAFGESVKSETHWSDFRRVNGVLFPFRSDEVEIATGRVLNSFITREIVVNHPLDVAVFSPPQFKRTPLQTLIETLFIERDDPKTVMWTYSDFRRANPTTDTDNAMRVAGYQILKTGQTESAIALLVANEAAYPKSTEAAFGVGRALHAAGRDDEARKAFQRALTLNPDNKRASDALKDIDGPKPDNGG